LYVDVMILVLCVEAKIEIIRWVQNKEQKKINL